MTVKIHVTNVDPKEIANAVQSIGNFLSTWKYLTKVEITIDTGDC